MALEYLTCRQVEEEVVAGRRGSWQPRGLGLGEGAGLGEEQARQQEASTLARVRAALTDLVREARRMRPQRLE